MKPEDFLVGKKIVLTKRKGYIPAGSIGTIYHNPNDYPPNPLFEIPMMVAAYFIVDGKEHPEAVYTKDCCPEDFRNVIREAINNTFFEGE